MCDLRNQQEDTAIQIDAEQTVAHGPVLLDPRDLFQTYDNNDSASESCESSCSEDSTVTGEMLVTRMNLFLTVVGFIIYIVDLGSDVGTSMYYASNGQWWRALVTLAIIYASVIMHTVIKWTNGQIYFTGAAAWLRYVAASLVNWPDLQHYGALCLLEWQRYRSPATTARLVPEWYERRRNVALLKCTEGACEACPQAMLQLCLLVPDLHGAWTWTDYLRIAGASVSLCTAIIGFNAVMFAVGVGAWQLHEKHWPASYFIEN